MTFKEFRDWLGELDKLEIADETVCLFTELLPNGEELVTRPIKYATVFRSERAGEKFIVFSWQDLRRVDLTMTAEAVSRDLIN